MEAEDVYKMTNAEDGFQTAKSAPWKGDWDLYKREFKVVAKINGMDSAIKLAEKLARGEELAALKKTDEELTRKGLAQ